MSDHDLILGARMNAEPTILRGCSSTELMLVAGGATLITVPIAGVLAFVIGPVVIGIAGVLIVGAVYFGAGLFQKIKRGRPDGYYQHWVSLWLERAGLARSSFILPKEGMLRVGRTWHQ